MDDFYETLILPHCDDSPHRGRLAEADLSRTDRNPLCGDEVRLELALEDHDTRIGAVAFEARGCTVSQAAASILCAHIEGRALAELADFTAHNMLELLQIPLTPRRQQCGLLPFRALKTLVYATLPAQPEPSGTTP